MPKQLTVPAQRDDAPRATYTEAAEATFRAALEQLIKSLPTHHADLVRLVDDGRFHTLEAIEAVLSGGER